MPKQHMKRTQVAELVRSGYADVKPNVMKRLSMRYPVLEAEVVFAVQQVHVDVACV